MKTYNVLNYSLDKYQMKLINSNNNILLIAGAGSGKTLTIIGKINYLIDFNCCKENEILLISFTNASVNDLKEKITYNCDIYTFHKLAIEILRNQKIDYNILKYNLLQYIIKEYLHTCSNKEQKDILKFLKINTKYNIFLRSNYFNSFCNMVETFINLFKTNNMQNYNLLQKKYNKNEKNILLIIFKIYYEYIIEKKSMNLFDYDDLIIYATKYAKQFNKKYKYIIIDEFQDTSFIRLQLIKDIFNKNSRIIVVGDDWQSIYRFTGCNLNIFINFDKYFKNVEKIYLKNTYRNSQKLINIASKFIMKNPLQIKKDLCSHKKHSNPIELVKYQKNILSIIIDKLLKITNDIMILSRNNNDLYNYINHDYVLIDKNNILYKKYKIKYYTVHKSKGLEAEYVIVLNCNDDYLGFPNKIENNILIEKLIPDEEIKYAEERRLFYVALTRCKEKVFLIYDKTKPSIFIKELKKELN